MCKVIKVLEGKEAQFIINLFKMVNRKGPEGNLIGHIDNKQGRGVSECPHRYSWGDDFYCDNQEHLKQFLENTKETPKCNKL